MRVLDAEHEHDSVLHYRKNICRRRLAIISNVLCCLATAVFVLLVCSDDAAPRNEIRHLQSIGSQQCCQCINTDICSDTSAVISLNDLASLTSWELFEVDADSFNTVELLADVSRGEYTGRAPGDVESIALGCLDTSKCYEFFLRVSLGDGGPDWSINYQNATLTSSEGFFFGDRDSIRFGNCSEETCKGRTSVTLAFDRFPQDIYWALYELGGALPTSFLDVGAGAYDSGLASQEVDIDLGCLNATKCYLFEMRDSLGLGGVQWSILFNGEERIQGEGSFTDIASVSFGGTCDSFFGPLEPVQVGSCGGEQDRFNICVVVAPRTPVALANLYADAASRWTSVISDDRGVDLQLPANVAGIGFVTATVFDAICNFESGIPSIVDDLFICADFGPARAVAILGFAMSLAVVQGPSIPPVVLGGRFTIASLGLADFSRLADVIVHEMGHILGIGSPWELAGLTPSTNPDNCNNYMGVNAIREYQALSGCMNGAPPVDDRVGACAHWDETCFRNEIMTPLVGNVTATLSRVTIASLDDLGYTVNYTSADPYFPEDLDPSCRCDEGGRKLKGASSGTTERPKQERAAFNQPKLSESRRLAAALHAEEEMTQVKAKLTELKDVPTHLLQKLQIRMTVLVSGGDGSIHEQEFTDYVS